MRVPAPFPRQTGDLLEAQRNRRANSGAPSLSTGSCGQAAGVWISAAYRGASRRCRHRAERAMSRQPRRSARASRPHRNRSVDICMGRGRQRPMAGACSAGQTTARARLAAPGPAIHRSRRPCRHYHPMPAPSGIRINAGNIAAGLCTALWIDRWSDGRRLSAARPFPERTRPSVDNRIGRQRRSGVIHRTSLLTPISRKCGQYRLSAAFVAPSQRAGDADTERLERFSAVLAAIRIHRAGLPTALGDNFVRDRRRETPQPHQRSRRYRRELQPTPPRTRGDRAAIPRRVVAVIHRSGAFAA